MLIGLVPDDMKFHNFIYCRVIKTEEVSEEGFKMKLSLTNHSVRKSKM